MTRKQFRDCTDPVAMVRMIHGMVSGRKLHLYFCGGCRTFEHLLYSRHSRNSLDVVERSADGLATEEDLMVAAYYAESPTFGLDYHPEYIQQNLSNEPDMIRRLVELGAISESVLSGGEFAVNREVSSMLYQAADMVYFLPYGPNELGTFLRSANQCKYVSWPGRWLKDCVFGNPFRPVLIPLSIRDSTVLSLAHGIYRERAFDRMPVLGDALEDAGCNLKEVLDHCRTNEPHVRGCWVVDQILGFE